MNPTFAELRREFQRKAKRLSRAFVFWAEDGIAVHDLVHECIPHLPPVLRAKPARYFSADLLTAEALLGEFKNPGIMVIERAELMTHERLQAKLLQQFKSTKAKAFLFLIHRQNKNAANLRADLSAAMQLQSLVVPPLRSRRLELGLFIRERLASKKLSIDEMAFERMLVYPWPGNDAELEACLRMLTENAHPSVITIDQLPLPIPVSSGEDLYPQDLPPLLRR